jgi:hypothetical protein
MIPDWITAFAAFAALLLSGYNTFTQRRDRFPRLGLESDKRYPEEGGEAIFSIRIVNEGSVPAQIRSVRLILDERRRSFRWVIPPVRVHEGRSNVLPPVEDPIRGNLWPNESHPRG